MAHGGGAHDPQGVGRIAHMAHGGGEFVHVARESEGEVCTYALWRRGGACHTFFIEKMLPVSHMGVEGLYQTLQGRILLPVYFAAAAAASLFSSPYSPAPFPRPQQVQAGAGIGADYHS